MINAKNTKCLQFMPGKLKIIKKDIVLDCFDYVHIYRGYGYSGYVIKGNKLNAKEALQLSKYLKFVKEDDGFDVCVVDFDNIKVAAE